MRMITTVCEETVCESAEYTDTEFGQCIFIVDFWTYGLVD
jgi:hypothetical protein